MPNLNAREVQKFEKFIAEFQAANTGQMDRVYHLINTIDAHPVYQPSCRGGVKEI
jgi:hypothetical protein